MLQHKPYARLSKYYRLAIFLDNLQVSVAYSWDTLTWFIWEGIIKFKLYNHVCDIGVFDTVGVQ